MSDDKQAIGQGDIVEGDVTNIVHFGAFVRLESGEEGLIHISEIANEYITNIDDFINLLIKVIDADLDEDHEVFLVGGQCISISDIIKKVSAKGVLNLKIDQKAERTYIDVRPIRAEQVFNWKRENHL